MDFFGARFFSAPQGRFLSPDKPFADQSPANPQSWNLYSYTRNNPLALVDDGGTQARAVTVAAKIEQFFKVVQTFDPANLLMSRGSFRSNAPRNDVMRGRSQFAYPTIETGGRPPTSAASAGADQHDRRQRLHHGQRRD
ncbi:MAG: hypothetical protein GC160_00070 [Acidobacteria bacterium]|nr:hypothetical protein [Acidobacteriota bacterium]